MHLRVSTVALIAAVTVLAVVEGSFLRSRATDDEEEWYCRFHKGYVLLSATGETEIGDVAGFINDHLRLIKAMNDEAKELCLRNKDCPPPMRPMSFHPASSASNSLLRARPIVDRRLIDLLQPFAVKRCENAMDGHCSKVPLFENEETRELLEGLKPSEIAHVFLGHCGHTNVDPEEPEEEMCIFDREERVSDVDHKTAEAIKDATMKHAAFIEDMQSLASVHNQISALGKPSKRQLEKLEKRKDELSMEAKKKLAKYLEGLQESGEYTSMEMRAFRATANKVLFDLNGWNKNEHERSHAESSPEDVVECPSFCDCPPPAPPPALKPKSTTTEEEDSQDTTTTYYSAVSR